MALVYERPPQNLALRQGEILGPIWEHRALHAATPLAEGASAEVGSIEHPLAVILSADCDLEQDHRERTTVGQLTAVAATEHVVNRSRKVLRQVLLCELYREADLAQLLPLGGDIRRRVSNNQDERYHRLQPGQIQDDPVTEMTEFFLDFKSTFSCHPTALYAGIQDGAIARVALVPPVFIHDLIHRYYSFASRIGIPE